MPLPVDKTPWPPQAHARPYMAFQEWAAWYSGDPTYLADVYASLPDAERPRRWMFWTRKGVNSAREQTRGKLHVPIAADIAMMSADLLFSEPPRITGGDQAATDRIEELLDEAGIHNRLLEGAELAAAMGGVYLRAAWDTDVADYPLTSIVGPDQANPTFSFGVLREVDFWEILTDDGESKVLRHVEHHEPGWITHGLFEGTADNLGYRIPLVRHPVTADYLGEGSSESDLEAAISLPIPGLAVAYVPNVRPARRLKRTDHGRSDFDGAEGLMDALDETYTSWMRDLRLAKARLLVPDQYLERRSPNSAAGFDMDQEIFSPLDMPPASAEGANRIEPVQFEIRFEAHRDSALELMDRIISTAGYSPQSFGMHIDGRAESGTALRVRERRSFMTRDRKQRYWRPAILDHLEMLLAIDREFFSGKGSSDRPGLEWADSITSDPNEVATTVQLLRTAEAASTETLVAMVHPDWDEEQVAAEVALISSQSPAAVPDLFAPEATGGAMPPEPEEDEDEEPEDPDAE